MVLPILTTSITLESPKRGIRAARTSENEVRFGISLCVAGPVGGRDGPVYAARATEDRSDCVCVDLQRCEMRPKRSIIAINACTIGSKPHDIPSDYESPRVPAAISRLRFQQPPEVPAQ